jgi:hypothetical protein
MSLVHQEIFYMFIRLHVKTTSLLIFIRSFFSIKNQITRRILFRGPCYGGLYPLVPISNESSKHAFITIKSSSSTWNCCLGNPSSFVAQQVLIKNKIAYFPEITPYVCDSYQLAKSNQLPYVPYHISTSVSTSPLEQVFNKCMGSCPSCCWETCIVCKLYR